MAQEYEEIVRQWYNRLRPEFLRRLTVKYSGLSLYDAENIYQDTFIAIQENLMRGRVKENTSWSNYIMTIGLNLASKEWRRIGKTDSADEGFDSDEESYSPTERKLEERIQELLDDEEENSLARNPEVQSILGYELKHTPEMCFKIIRFFYWNREMSMEDIAEEVGYRNAQTAKAKKSQCMNDLIKRVSAALQRAGFDVKPKKRNRNGKN